jgi:hypothetical protein
MRMLQLFLTIQNVRILTGFISFISASVVWWLSSWLMDPRFSGSNPAENDGFFKGYKNP